MVRLSNLRSVLMWERDWPWDELERQFSSLAQSSKYMGILSRYGNEYSERVSVSKSGTKSGRPGMGQTVEKGRSEVVCRKVSWCMDYQKDGVTETLAYCPNTWYHTLIQI